MIHRCYTGISTTAVRGFRSLQERQELCRKTCQGNDCRALPRTPQGNFCKSFLDLQNFTKLVWLTHRPSAYTDSQIKTTPYLVSASTTRYGVIFICPTSRPCAVGREILHSPCRGRRPRRPITNGYRKCHSVDNATQHHITLS